MSRPFLWIIGGVVSLGLITLLAISLASETPADTSIGFGEVTVEGEFLPELPRPEDGLADLAVGTMAATVSGSDWKGNSFTISPDGRPKVVMFLAHWCQFCQAEVPEIQHWANSGLAPDDVDIYSVTSLSNPTRVEWPPQDWLEREGWTFPVIMDDTFSTVATAYGLSGTPFYVVLDGENRVLLRLSGQIGIERLQVLVAVAQASAGS